MYPKQFLHVTPSYTGNITCVDVGLHFMIHYVFTIIIDKCTGYFEVYQSCAPGASLAHFHISHVFDFWDMPQPSGDPEIRPTQMTSPFIPRNQGTSPSQSRDTAAAPMQDMPIVPPRYPRRIHVPPDHLYPMITH